MLKTPSLHNEQDTKVKKVSMKKLKEVFQPGGDDLEDSSSQAAPTQPEGQDSNSSSNSSLVQLSLPVPSRLQEWLAVPENGFLDDLTTRHSVQVLQDAPRHSTLQGHPRQRDGMFPRTCVHVGRVVQNGTVTL